MSARTWALCCGVLVGCGPVEVGKLTLVLQQGSVDPFADPGDGQNSSRPVAALRFSWDSALVRWPGDAGVITTPLGAGDTLKVELPAPSAPARLTIAGLLTATDEVWSLGRSTLINPPSGSTPTTVSVLLGPADGWTSLSASLPGERRFTRVAPLGALGALIVGGGDALPDGGLRASEPGLLRFDVATSTLTPLTGAATLGAIAVPLGSGRVLHGLGQLADGGLSSKLFLTDAAGDSREVMRSGASLEARVDASALLLRDGTVLILGGRAESGPLPSVVRLTVDEASAQATANAFPPLSIGRARAAVAQLSTGEVLIAGGLGANGVALDDGQWMDLAVATPAWHAAANRMTDPRVGASAVRLEDDSVLLWGGGPDSGDVFSLTATDDGGFLKLAIGVTGLHQATAARVGRSVLFVGGETGAEAPFAARFVPAVQTPALGQQYGGTWSRVKATGRTRHGTGLVVLETSAVLSIGGAAQDVELFTPSAEFLEGQ